MWRIALLQQLVENGGSVIEKLRTQPGRGSLKQAVKAGIVTHTRFGPKYLRNWQVTITDKGRSLLASRSDDAARLSR